MKCRPCGWVFRFSRAARVIRELRFLCLRGLTGSHPACHLSQNLFLGPLIAAYSASRHSYRPPTIRSTVKAPMTTASLLVPRLHRVAPLSRYGASSRGLLGARVAV